VPPPYDRFEGISMFDDKGEVKRLVARLIQDRDPDVTIERMRKMDFSYIFTLSRRSRSREVEISRSEIDASWDWRNGNIDETIQKKVENTIKEF
jgi:hypothetical protein